VSGFADNDAGGIATYSLAGIQFGYDLLWVILASQIVLFFTQEVGARLGLATGQGLTGLVRGRYGVRWAAFVVVLMLVANLGTTLAEFAGIGAEREARGDEGGNGTFWHGVSGSEPESVELDVAVGTRSPPSGGQGAFRCATPPA
jgi:hypothetical protein